jgi:hypothetical protein
MQSKHKAANKANALGRQKAFFSAIIGFDENNRIF